MNNQVGHVTNQISCQAEVEKHKEDIEDHFPCIHRMQISITNRRQGSNGPVHRRHIPNPNTLLKKIISQRRSNPGPLRVMIPCSKKIIEASRTVNSKKGNLQNHPIIITQHHHINKANRDTPPYILTKTSLQHRTQK